MFPKGAILKFKEVKDAGDEAERFEVIEPDELRPLVKLLNTGMTIEPMNRYDASELVLAKEI